MHQPAAPLWPLVRLSCCPRRPATFNRQHSSNHRPHAAGPINLPAPQQTYPHVTSAHARQHCSANRTEIRPHRNRARVAKKWQPVIRLRNRQRSAPEHIFCPQLRHAQRPTRRSSPAPLFFATPLNNKYSTPRPVPSTPVSTDRAISLSEYRRADNRGISLSEYRRADNCKVATAGDAPPPSAHR